MRIVRIVAIVTALVAPSLLLARQQSESADQQLKAAMHRELVGGDLRAAIKEYEEIVSRYRTNRPVAARALLQIAQCHDKLGQAEARKVYERIVRDYSDQAEPAGQARGRLAAMDPHGVASPSAGQGIARPLRSPMAFHTISPDGTKAAGIDYSKGMNLAWHELGAPRAKLLTEFDWSTTVVVDAWSAWSRDGRQIAYTQKALRGGQLLELRTTTLAGEAKTVFRPESGISLVLGSDWLPNGRSIVVLLRRADKTWAIGLVPVSGGAFTPLRSLQWTADYGDRPRVSPDGRFVLFSDSSSGPRDIQVVSIDGRTATRLTDHPAEDHSPVWSPDGRHVAFLSSRLGSEALWILAVKDGQPAGDPVRIKDGMTGGSLKDWTTKGLVYSQSSRTSDIYTVAVDPVSRQLAGRPQQLAYARTGRNATPVWSPDGRHLAFVSGSLPEPNRRYIVVIPGDGGNPREFLIPTSEFGPEGSLEPLDLRWFGDGSGLGFSGRDDQGRYSVFQLSLATGAWAVLPSPGGFLASVEWDQTGARLLYRPAGKLQILERDLGTHHDRPVTSDESLIAEGLRLSPDRRWLAFTLRPGPRVPGTARLMVTNVQTGETRMAMEATIPSTAVAHAFLGVPAWAPDGQSLLVTRLTDRNRLPELLVVPVDSGPGHTMSLDSLFPSPARGSNALYPAISDVVWSPDGTRITLAVSETRSGLSIIESVVPPAKSTASQRRQP